MKTHINSSLTNNITSNASKIGTIKLIKVGAFHGHANVGTLEGEAAGDVKVFNVAKPILMKAGYTQPFYLFEV